MILCGLVCIFSLIGCNSQKVKENKLTKITLSEVVHSVFYAPLYVAINEGFFEEEGLSVELSTANGADKVVTSILSNNAQIGLAGGEASIYVYQEGKEDYLINFAQLTKRDGSFLLGRHNENFNWENTEEKTIIGGRPGGMPEITLEHIIKSFDLVPQEDVEIITNLAFTATAGAFKSGTGDYIALFEPTASLMEQEGFTVLASIGEDSGELPYTVFMAQKSYVEENTDVIQKFTNAIYKAQVWVDTHSSYEVATSIHPFFSETDIELLTSACKRYQEVDAWDKTPLLEKESFNYLQKIIKESGYLEEVIDSEEVINNDFAEKALE